MTTRRTLLLACGAAAAAIPLRTIAQQQPTKVARIGFLSSASPAGFRSRVDALRAGLRDLGYEEGKNIAIEFRWAEGKSDRLPELAAELVRLNVDVLVTHATPPTRAAKQATATIPIVIASSGDAVATGLIASLARPGGNITGSTFFQPELMVKRLELIKDASPRANRVAVLLMPDPITEPMLKTLEISGRALKVALHQFEVRGPGDFANAFSAMAKSRIDAVAIPE